MLIYVILKITFNAVAVNEVGDIWIKSLIFYLILSFLYEARRKYPDFGKYNLQRVYNYWVYTILLQDGGFSPRAGKCVYRV